jgi:hypothetical protein
MAPDVYERRLHSPPAAGHFKNAVSFLGYDTREEFFKGDFLSLREKLTLKGRHIPPSGFQFDRDQCYD